MTACIDCGEPTAPTIDVPLCTACYALAIHLVGSAQARIDTLLANGGNR